MDFWKAFEHGDLEVARRLLDDGLPIDEAAEHPRSSWTPLYSACYSGHLEVVKLLLGRGASARGSGQYSSPLHGAVRAAYPHTQPSSLNGLEIMRLLISHGAEVSGTTARAPLWSACFGGSLEAARMLLDAGAFVDPISINDYSVDPGTGTALSLAAEKGHCALVALLLERGADIDRCADRRGEVALGFACRANHGDVVRLLLDNGANPEGRGFTEPPLYTAAYRASSDVLRTLLEAAPTLTPGYATEARRRFTSHAITVVSTTFDCYWTAVRILTRYLFATAKQALLWVSLA